MNRTSMVAYLTMLFFVLMIVAILIKPYLLALSMGAIFAHLCYPLYNRMKGTKRYSVGSSILVTIGLVFVIIIPSFTVLVLGFKQGMHLLNVFATQDKYSLERLSEHLLSFPMLSQWITDFDAANLQIQDSMRLLIARGSSVAMAMIYQIPFYLLQVLLTIVSCCYFLIDGKRFLVWLAERTPLDKSIRNKIADTFNEISSSVIWATFFASFAQAIIILLSFLFLGVSAPILAAGATFLLASIPMIGSSPVWGTAAIILLLNGDPTKSVLMVIFGVSTGIIDNIIRAIVLKGRNRMHPLVSIFSVLSGVSLFGLLGVFIGPIIAALMITLLKMWPVVFKRNGLFVAT